MTTERRGVVGTVGQIETARAILARLSEQRQGDGRLRDAIALVRHELGDILDAAGLREEPPPTP